MSKKQVSLMTGMECTPGNLAELTDIEIAIESKIWSLGGVDVYLRGKNYHVSHNDLWIVTGFTSVKYKSPGELLHAPSFSLRASAVQNLMDEPWRAGVRPSEKQLPSSDATQAMGHHLEDMRKIAFMFLEGDERKEK